MLLKEQRQNKKRIALFFSSLLEVQVAKRAQLHNLNFVFFSPIVVHSMQGIIFLEHIIV